MSKFNTNRFGAGVSNPPAPPPPQQLPAPIPYEVLVGGPNAMSLADWVRVDAIEVQVNNGCLLLFRGIWVDEDCTVPRAIASVIYAPGEWRAVRTEFEGYRKSELAL